MAKAWLVVTAFDRDDNLPGLYARLDAQTHRDFTLVLVDHGTKPIDTSTLPPYVHYVRSTPDKWWTGAMNVGLREVLRLCPEDDEQYVVFQNDDVEFDKTFLSDLIAASKEKGNAVVGAITVYAGDDRVMDANNLFNILRARHDCPYRNRKLSDVPRELLVSDILKGRGVVYPLSCVRKIGFLYERLARRSDPEYAWRAKQFGYPVYIDPRIVVRSSLDPRTQMQGRFSFAKVKQQLFSPRSYANLPDAFFYFYKCLDPLRATYCFLYHTAFIVSFCMYKYGKGLVSAREGEAVPQ